MLFSVKCKGHMRTAEELLHQLKAHMTNNILKSQAGSCLVKSRMGLATVMALTCNPSTLGGQDEWTDHLRSGVQDQPHQHGETLSTKNAKISLAW